LNLATYKENFLNYLSEEITVKEPKNLYQPISYILNLGGKRLRPILTLMACELFNGNYKNALNASLAIEVFHNFTLMHDDIMDHAELRRGKQTVHKKWNENTGILSGDAMLIYANQLLENYDVNLYKKLMIIFNKTALEVCEGQQYDIDFETRNDVTITEYIKMISYKTAVLVACALKMGALIANASKTDCENIYNFGFSLGIAFQLQDDYLDTFGNVATFGKKIGGDILENKKTFLYLKTLELANKEDKIVLQKLFSTTEDSVTKIEKVTAFYKKYKTDNYIKNEVENYTQLAYRSLEKTTLSNESKNVFIELGDGLLDRVD